MAFRNLFVFVLLLAPLFCKARETPFIRDPSEKPSPSATVNEADEANGLSNDPYATVVPLNDVLFKPNVLNEHDEDVAVHWVVYFCPTWWEPCRNLLKPFALQSAEWQARANDGLLHNQIRFARVDCASHKPLCNAEKVDNYPTVQHYFQGRVVSTWTANGRNDETRLVKWLGAELGRVPAASTLLRKAGDPSLVFAKVVNAHFTSGDRMLDLFVLLSVLALSFWKVCTNPAILQKPGISNMCSPAERAVAPATASDRVGSPLPDERSESGSQPSSIVL